MDTKNTIEIYQADDGQTQINVRFTSETVWLTQGQMVELFGRDQSVLSRHIRNAKKDGEIDTQSNMQKMHIAHSDKPVTLYDLDVVISVGYRVKSPQGVQFRRWATQRLKEHLTRGYTLNQQRFEQNAQELEHALALVKKAAHLLYVVVKNHPFSDGNKCSGAWLFIDFLNKNGRLFNYKGEAVINVTGLATESI